MIVEKEHSHNNYYGSNTNTHSNNYLVPKGEAGRCCAHVADLCAIHSCSRSHISTLAYEKATSN